MSMTMKKNHETRAKRQIRGRVRIQDEGRDPGSGYKQSVGCTTILTVAGKKYRQAWQWYQ